MTGERLELIASEIVQRSHVRRFPDDYILPQNIEKISIPQGDTVMMFRQDENVVVSIDSQRIYLRSLDQAKFIYYCAKKGLTEVYSPYHADIHEAIAKFEEDLDHTQRMIDSSSKNLSEIEANELRTMCSLLLGYKDIF